MTLYWIISLSLFAIFIVLITWLSWNYYKKQNKEKTWKIWGLNISYWEGVATVSCGLTVLTLFLLKWINLLTF
ncbi:hypothetical protein [Ancylomarina sp. 16SWW S1-10-2]|uniref:hypothetical protein n=1 Tax=Ancylomarina sp. 16SWW S1-10-2 TaxID=2499681 RepID=UPI0012AE5997|nr:hypothetical protein [Ancylomarina sp. 16SWW S1-10-2]MRT94682.1 hypothetical protein [Ancylomarina sp. 16SWW S1-10-2]